MAAAWSRLGRARATRGAFTPDSVHLVHCPSPYRRERGPRCACGVVAPVPVAPRNAPSSRACLADLTDNAIVVLDGFPSLPRLSMLLLNNNRISRISVANLERSLPRLETLVLTNNRISRIEDVEALGRLKSLRHLSLIDNPVTKLRFYRSSVIHAVPQLRWLDFARVRQGERKLAQDLHKKGEIGARVDGEFVPGEGVPEVMGPPADEDMAGAGAEERGEAQPAGGKRALTAEESTALRAMVRPRGVAWHECTCDGTTVVGVGCELVRLPRADCECDDGARGRGAGARPEDGGDACQASCDWPLAACPVSWLCTRRQWGRANG